MIELKMRAPGVALPAAELLGRIPLFGSGSGSETVFETGSGALVNAGALLALEIPQPRRAVELSPDAVIFQAGPYLGVEAPAGFSTLPDAPYGDAHRQALRALASLDEPLTALYSPGYDQGGLWLFTTDEHNEQDLRVTCCALVEAPPWDEGVLQNKEQKQRWRTGFRVRARRRDVAEVEFIPETQDPMQVRRHAAAAGMPILADPIFGGRMIAGGIRLYISAITCPSLDLEYHFPEPAGFWPDEPVFPAAEKKPSFLISRETARALKRGHPWILPDEQSDDAGRYSPGTEVRLRLADGSNQGIAHIEGPGRIAARIWQADFGRDEPVASVEARVQKSLERRAPLLDALRDKGDTNAFRLIHGEADQLPGIAVDYLGGVLRALVQGGAAYKIRDRVLDTLQSSLGDLLVQGAPVVQVLNLRPQPKGEMKGVTLIRGALPEKLFNAKGRMVVQEAGLSFEVDLGLEAPCHTVPGTGLFLDQRANRRRLKKGGVHGRWLNLFCHTGAFSALLLAEGVESVVSVDLSARYLEWMEDNLRLNDLPLDQHTLVRSDARRYLQKAPAEARFDGIIVDPPTAAAVGKRYWSVKKGYAELVAEVLPHLVPGGTLLLSRNDRGARGSLPELLRKEALKQKRRVADIRPAGPGVDFPTLAQFPEGDSFTAIFARVD